MLAPAVVSEIVEPRAAAPRLGGYPAIRPGLIWERAGRGYAVVCPDLRGYERSRGPAPTADHSALCKRAVATDMLEAMGKTGRCGVAACL